MQNARVIQLGSSGVKVTRNSASFDEAFGGYSSKKKKKFSNATGDEFGFGIGVGSPNPTTTVTPTTTNPSSTSNTANLPIVTDAERDYKIMSLFGSTTSPLSLVSGGGTINFPTNVPLKMVRSYKILDNKPIEVKLTTTSNGLIYKVDPYLAKDVLTGLQASQLQPNPTGTTTGTTTSTTTQSALAQLLPTLTLEKISRFTTDNPLMPLYQGFYKVVNDVYGVRDNGLSKKFLKDSIVEGYLQTFNNPTTGGKSAYWVVQSEVPTTVGNASTTTASPSSVASNVPATSVAPSVASTNTSSPTISGTQTTSTGTVGTTTTQTSPKPNTMAQTKSSATGTTMASFKLPLYALAEVTQTVTNTNQGGYAEPNQGGGTFTGGGSSSDALDQLNAQIEAEQMAQMQQEGGQEQSFIPSAYEQSIYTYTPSEDELMTDVDTNYAPDTETESSFDGYDNSNAMENKINDLCTKIAWNKEMAEMLKRKKGVDKTELKAEYVAKVDRVNELLKELKGCETPANKEYIMKMLKDCDMMRPSMKKTMKKDIVIQNANPKVIDLGDVNPSEFKNDLGNTLMEDENSSFMGDVINYSDFSGSATSTALIGVGIGAVLGVIGIVVMKKMGK